MLLVSLSWANITGANTAREYQLKAAYLLNFARFVYWPEATFSAETKNFNICVSGENPFGDSLDKLSDKKIQNRSINVYYENDSETISNCHIFYISESEKEDYKQLIAELPVGMLTVSDIEGFAGNGGMIEFVRISNKIKFEINVGESLNKGIKYRSQLLEVAEKLR